MTNLGYGMTRNDNRATSLTDEELIGLRLRPTPSRDELNLIELTHIAEVMDDSRWRYLSTSQLLDDHELRRLHKEMFGDVWTWAGKYRTTEKNIGCDPIQIAAQVRDLCESAKLWLDNGMPIDEAGCRFHHGLVAIHPFVNGNGRHGRLAADLLMMSAGAARFTWGGASLVKASATRSAYVASLRAADLGDFGPLLEFART